MTDKEKSFLLKGILFIISVLLLCVLNWICYERNGRLLRPLTIILWVAITFNLIILKKKETNKNSGKKIDYQNISNKPKPTASRESTKPPPSPKKD